MVDTDKRLGASSRYSVLGDWGLGDPTPVGWDPSTDTLSLGLGDPARAPVIPLPLAGGKTFADEGGEIVEVAGEYTTTGPYRVRLDDGAGQLYPVGGFCYSARQGSGVDCYTDPKRRILSFAMPPAPLGLYTLVITFGPLFGSEVRLVDAVEVVTRAQALEVWKVRGRFPRRWQVGPQDAQLAPLDLPEHPTEELPTMTRALGQVAQLFAGTPTTRLSGTLLHSDTTAELESTHGFPAGGAEVWIGPRRYSYTAISGTTLTGLELKSDSDAMPLQPKTEVILDARSILPD